MTRTLASIRVGTHILGALTGRTQKSELLKVCMGVCPIDEIPQDKGPLVLG